MSKSIQLVKPVGGGSSEYLKLKEGEYRLRIVSPIIAGWEAWNRSADSYKVHRREEEFTAEELDALGIDGKPKQFYAMIVWDYTDSKFKCWVVTQYAIKEALYNYANDEEWGDLTGYDITVIRTGTDMTSTKYSVMPKPHKKFTEDTSGLDYDLTNLYTGDDVFKN